MVRAGAALSGARLPPIPIGNAAFASSARAGETTLNHESGKGMSCSATYEGNRIRSAARARPSGIAGFDRPTGSQTTRDSAHTAIRQIFHCGAVTPPAENAANARTSAVDTR